jgi:hypothetical protein
LTADVGNSCFWLVDFFSFCSFVEAVSEKIFLEIFQSETRIAYGGPVCQRIGSKISNPNKIPSMDAFYQDLGQFLLL